MSKLFIFQTESLSLNPPLKSRSRLRPLLSLHWIRATLVLQLTTTIRLPELCPRSGCQTTSQLKKLPPGWTQSLRGRLRTSNRPSSFLKEDLRSSMWSLTSPRPRLCTSSAASLVAGMACARTIHWQSRAWPRSGRFT